MAAVNEEIKEELNTVKEEGDDELLEVAAEIENNSFTGHAVSRAVWQRA